MQKLLIGVLGSDVCQVDEKGATLVKNRKKAVKRLRRLVAERVYPLMRGKELSEDDIPVLFWGLRVAEFLESSELFFWVKRLCLLPLELIDEVLGGHFVPSELPYLLASIVKDWKDLKKIIESPRFDQITRGAVLDALTFCIAKGKVEHSEVIAYFKDLFHLCLRGEVDDAFPCTPLVAACADIWPSECLEEIREAFGLSLVDTYQIDLGFVLDSLAKGEEQCMRSLQNLLDARCLDRPLEEMVERFDKEQAERIKRLSRLAEQASREIDRAVEGHERELSRNALCDCGSGRKYKKCCMNKSVARGGVVVDKSQISSSSPQDLDLPDTLSEEEKASISALYRAAQEDPEEVLEKVPSYIAKYPELLVLPHILYMAYQTMGRSREAIWLLKKTLQRFPDHLFSRLEYAFYLLRRGEPEKAHESLNNAATLSELYPERELFSASEWICFAHTIGCCWVHKGDIEKVKAYLEVIRSIDPNCREEALLEKEMRREFFIRCLDRLSKESTQGCHRGLVARH